MKYKLINYINIICDTVDKNTIEDTTGFCEDTAVYADKRLSGSQPL